ncbi:probable inorganic phosphate transporter 1-3 [Selaginella moellendorffii]|uniref:probable inorganic phosphate transporter 1-3 n=1 Tax=Selaginella moellendorffii TaxID=88036 RepID=UPI000D1C4E30|nr:probable inorganic phosphate transporter 1-3 [Selaginella moellendorffii]|eukprot:XP_024519561.1 probable inorganic phosphate transporter 1-3 [Selaginella moellendorffii]
MATTTTNKNDQLNVLDALDTAKTQWYHVTAVIISGMGFFTDAYDLFCISLLTKLLGRIYYYDPSTGTPGELPVSINAAVSGIALCGTFTGQLFFGWLGDRLGRKRVYGITSMIMVVFSIASGFSFGSSARAVIGTLCFFRFWLGFGIGGDYPLSATIMSEYANTKTRGAFVAAVFAMQGVGILVAAVVTMAVSGAFMVALRAPSFEESPGLSTPHEADYVWRIVFMLGSVPAALTYYWRMKMPETARYTALVAGDLDRANADMSKVLQVDLTDDHHRGVDHQFKIAKKVQAQSSFPLFSSRFARRHGLHLFVTTTTWFLQAFAFYSQQLFQKDIYTQVGFIKPAKTMSALQEALVTARAQALVALCGTVPGYWVTVALIDRLGRKPIQLLGFLMMGTFMYALAVPYESYWRGKHLDAATGKYQGGHNVGFVVLFALTFFFANFGPNSTTFIVPAEVFPARLRSTCHGISAGVGKIGSILGAFGFVYVSQPTRKSELPRGYHHPGIGMRNALLLLASASMLGFFISLLMPETKGKSLEELSGESVMNESKVDVQSV